MNIANIQTFLTVVKSGSLIAASKQLNVTQSTVTARLHGLEDEVGQKLLHRQKTGASLTAAGLKFKRYAEVMIEVWQQAKQETSLPEGMNAICNIGCHHDLWPQLGHGIFTKIFYDHQDVALTAWPATQMDIDRWMMNGVIDLAIGYEPSTIAGQSSVALGEDILVLVGDQPDRPIRHDDGYVFVDGGEVFNRNHTAAYTGASIARVSYGNAIWAREHLLTKGGSAYLPMRMVEDDLANQQLFLLKDAPRFTRPYVAIFNNIAMDTWPWLQQIIIQISAELAHPKSHDILPS